MIRATDVQIVEGFGETVSIGEAMSIKWKKWLPSAAVGAVAFTLTTETSYGFFPPVPAADNRVTVSPPPPTSPVRTLPTVKDPVVTVPRVPPPPFQPPVPPVCHPTVPPPVQHPHVCGVPEPATIVSSILGLSALGLASIRRRK